MKFGLSEHQLQLILNCIKRFSEIEKVVVFGSRAMGNFKPGSDIDLLISGTHVNSALVTQLFGLLNEEVSVPFHFDLILDSADLAPELRNHINQYGLIFYLRS